MAGVEIEVVVGNRPNLLADLHDNYRVRVRAEPDCCPRCRANADDPGDQLKPPLHAHCRCYEELEKVN